MSLGSTVEIETIIIASTANLQACHEHLAEQFFLHNG